MNFEFRTVVVGISEFTYGHPKIYIFIVGGLIRFTRVVAITIFSLYF